MGEKRKQRRNCHPSSIAKSEVIDTKFLQIEAYICAQCIGNYQKKTKPKAITGINLEETTKNIKALKAGTGSRMNSGWRGEQCCKMQISQCSIFSSLFTLLSFWDLICNDEFDSNSSCLDRLNNFGTISS